MRVGRVFLFWVVVTAADRAAATLQARENEDFIYAISLIRNRKRCKSMFFLL